MGILWAISVMWEITEISFAHLLPNFAECWWDALILDVLVCNGLGIWCGLKICKLLEMREYRWASIRDITSTKGKLKRVVLQFTPESWAPVRWLDPKCTYMRFFAVCQLVLLWQVSLSVSPGKPFPDIEYFCRSFPKTVSNSLARICQRISSRMLT